MAEVIVKSDKFGNIYIGAHQVLLSGRFEDDSPLLIKCRTFYRIDIKLFHIVQSESGGIVYASVIKEIKPYAYRGNKEFQHKNDPIREEKNIEVLNSVRRIEVDILSSSQFYNLTELDREDYRPAISFCKETIRVVRDDNKKQYLRRRLTTHMDEKDCDELLEAIRNC